MVIILRLAFARHANTPLHIRIEHGNDGKRVGRVRLLTQNAFIRPAPINHAHGDNKRARFESLLHLIENQYDVVCLQELWGSYYKRKLFSTQFPFIVTSPSLPGKTDGGLMILSRFPIVFYEFTPFLDTTFPDNMVYKGYLTARIDTGANKFITVVNAHLQASYHNLEFPDKQLSQLTGMYLKVADYSPLALCGDFNINALIPNVHEKTALAVYPLQDHVLQKPTVTCVYDARTNKEVSTTIRMCSKCAREYARKQPFKTHTVEHQRLDHIWTSPTIRTSKCRVIPNIVSDHLGVEATLVL